MGTVLSLSLLYMLALHFGLAPGDHEICKETPHPPYKECSISDPALVVLWKIGEAANYWAAGITALATVLLAYITYALVKVTDRQARFTKEAEHARRAWVFAVGIFGVWEPAALPGQYDWRFRPTWSNSGETPTKNMTLYVQCELRNSPLPEGFDFSRTIVPPGSGLLAPKSTLQGGAVPNRPAAAITPQDIADVQRGAKFLYLWG